MRSILIPALCGALALAGCQTIGDSDAVIKKNLAQACDVIETGHASFLIIVASYPVKPSIVATEAKAHASAADYCDHPENANTMTAVLKVVQLGAIIVAALTQASQVQAAAGG